MADCQWYSEAVRWASSVGITGGYSKDFFGTNDVITREQLATMLYRYAEYKWYDTSGKKDPAIFTDSGEISSWVYEVVSWAYGNGLLGGYGNLPQ